MKTYLFLLINFTLLSISYAQTKAVTSQKISLYETSSEVLMTDSQIRGLAGMVAFSKGNTMGDSIFPSIKAEWEKSLNSNFSQQEIKYLNDALSSALFKRYFKFQKDFSNPVNITKVLGGIKIPPSKKE